MNNQIERNVSPVLPLTMVRTHRSQAEWAALVTEWEQSSQSQKAFCEAKGLCYRNFSQWKSRLKKNTTTVAPTSSATPQDFVRIGIEGDTPQTSLRLSKVTVQMPGDIALTLECDIASIVTLIHGLSPSPC